MCTTRCQRDGIAEICAENQSRQVSGLFVPKNANFEAAKNRIPRLVYRKSEATFRACLLIEITATICFRAGEEKADSASSNGIRKLRRYNNGAKKGIKRDLII